MDAKIWKDRYPQIQVGAPAGASRRAQLFQRAALESLKRIIMSHGEIVDAEASGRCGKSPIFYGESNNDGQSL